MFGLNNKNGAMFGLDARIALAIFGALSVISGAALYSAIQQAKAVRLATQIEEFSKAVDGYRSDTARDIIGFSFLDRFGQYSPEYAYAQDLVSKHRHAIGWKGPYVKDFTKMSYWGLEKDGYTYTFSFRHDDAFDDFSDTYGSVCTENNRSDCNLYILLLTSADVVSSGNYNSFLKKVGEVIDGNDDLLSGRFRVLQKNNSTTSLMPFDGTNYYKLFYKINLAFPMQHYW